jgi:hypothetical protein
VKNVQLVSNIRAFMHNNSFNKPWLRQFFHLQVHPRFDHSLHQTSLKLQIHSDLGLKLIF